MIKIYLNSQNRCSAEWGSYSFVEWRKGNKGYKCCREYNGEAIIYSLYVWNTTTYNPKPRIRSESLADINKRLAKTEVEIVEG